MGNGWRFWVVTSVPLLVILLTYFLDIRPRLIYTEKQQNMTRTETLCARIAAEVADLRGTLTEVYQRSESPNLLPGLYWEALADARSARISYLEGNCDQAGETIRLALEKIYQIPLPGPPFIHSDPIRREVGA